jgi:hypothetical protein
MMMRRMKRSRLDGGNEGRGGDSGRKRSLLMGGRGGMGIGRGKGIDPRPRNRLLRRLLNGGIERGIAMGIVDIGGMRVGALRRM